MNSIGSFQASRAEQRCWQVVRSEPPPPFPVQLASFLPSSGQRCFSCKAELDTERNTFAPLPNIFSLLKKNQKDLEKWRMRKATWHLAYNRWRSTDKILSTRNQVNKRLFIYFELFTAQVLRSLLKHGLVSWQLGLEFTQVLVMGYSCLGSMRHRVRKL